MNPIRLLEPEDFERSVRCGTCDEWLPVDQALSFEGEGYHESCRPDLVHCCWCGDALLRTDAKQVGDEFYHQTCFKEAGS